MAHVIKILKFSNKFPHRKFLNMCRCVYICMHMSYQTWFRNMFNTKLTILSKCSLLYHKFQFHFYSQTISNQFYLIISKLTIMYQPVHFIWTLYFFLAGTTLRNEQLCISFLNSTSIYVSKSIFVIIQYIKTVSERYSVQHLTHKWLQLI
jgi:hypothetical protein